jgi:hypothetical protein
MKRDLKLLRRDFEEFRTDIRGDLEEFKEDTNESLKEKASKNDLKELEMQLRNEMQRQTVRIYGAIVLAAAILGVMNYLT